MAPTPKIDWSHVLLPTLAPAGDAYAQQQTLHRVKLGMIAAVAVSYVVDTLTLAAFSACGVISAWIPLLFLACGLTESAIAYYYVRGPQYRAWTDRYMTLPRMAVSCLIQLVFIVIAPPVALYFISLLFIIFGFGCLRLKVREAATLWVLVAVALAVVVLSGVDILQLPHATPAQRAIGLVAGMLTLGRSILIGLFSSHLRSVLGSRYKEAASSLAVSEADRTRTSIALHEDLGQDLAGIAMTLSAYAARLRQRSPAEAVDLDEATAQLRGAVEKARVLAFPTLKQRRDGRPQRDQNH